MSAKNETRYPGSAALAYDRQQPIQERRRSPSPGPSGGYAPYDRYGSPRNGPAYSYGGNYRQDSWRPDRASYTPYSSPPAPDRYGHARNNEQDPWTRPSWRSPEMHTWTDRRLGQQPSMYENSWSRPRRDTMAQPMFEPSENWKQSHGYPSDIQEGADNEREYDRYPDLPMRDPSPERPVRNNVSQSYSPNDRFRRYTPVQDYRDSYPYSHTRSDSYRQYFDRRAWDSPYYSGEDYSGSYESKSRSPSFSRFSGRARRHQRSASGGSIPDGAPSPIRTRTNLPDRTLVVAKSPSEYPPDFISKRSDSYGISPVSRTRSRSHSSSRSSPFERIQRRDISTISPQQSVRYRDATSIPADIQETMPHFEGETRATTAARRSPDTNTQELKDGFIHDDNPLPRETTRTVEKATDNLPAPMLEQLPASSMHQDISFPESQSQPAISATELTGVPQASQEPSPEPDIPLAIQHRRNSATHAPPASDDAEPAESKRDKSLSRPETPPGEPIPLSEALRMVVAMRLQCDRQTQEERVDPVLHDNLSRVETLPPPETTSPEALIGEFTSGERFAKREQSFLSAKPSLEVRFAQRQADLNEKVQRLKEEYLVLHERWLVQCGKLDEVARAIALQEAAATAGRTTRRSAASMGDAVRSDLEMEQIIASLGNEELTDANHLGARNAATIPDMISVTTGEVEYHFDDTNNEVENPSEFYVPHTRMEDWTDEEITTLVEKFAEFPKQFGIIADYLPNKTTAECVSFYYLHKHKHIDFRKVVARRAASKRRRGGRKQKSNALLADIMKHDDEVHASNSGKRRKTVLLPGTEPRKGRRSTANDKQTPNETPTPEPDGDGRKRKRRATTRVMTAVEQEEVNEDGDVDTKPAKRTRRTRKPRTSSGTPAGTPTISDETSGSIMTATKFIDQTEVTIKKKAPSANWSDDDKALFLRLLAQYGDDFKRIAASMPNKTTIQVSTFYKANVVTMDLEKVVQSAPKRSPSPDNESWEHVTLPGSGAVTPSISSSSTPAESYPGLNYSAYPFDTHYHMSMQMASSSYGAYSMPYPQMPNGSMTNSSSQQYYSTTVESMRAQYGASVDARSCTYLVRPPEDQYTTSSHFMARSGGDGTTSLLGLSSRPFSLGQISHQTPSAAPATFRTAFRSTFPYSSLSPASFASRDSSVRSTNGRAARRQIDGSLNLQVRDPSEAGTSNARVTFDSLPSFAHPPPSWTNPSLQTEYNGDS